MGIWRNLYRFSASLWDRTGTYHSRAKGKPEASEPRGLHLEQCEDRILLSVSPSSSQYKELLSALVLENAIRTASDLSQYSREEQEGVDSWVVGVKDGANARSLANEIGADNLGSAEFINGTYVWQFSTNTSWEEAAKRMNSLNEVVFFYPLTVTEVTTNYVPLDPLYGNQWHLKNTGNAAGFPGGTADINVQDAWDYVTGSGVVVAIVDGGTEYLHEDLRGRYLQAFSWDYIDGDNDPAPQGAGDNHGTAVAGLALASNNSLGGVGVAYDANYAAIRLIGGWTTELDIAMALGSNLDIIDVFNNSWGPVFYGAPAGPGPLVQAAMEQGVIEGRGGKGVIYVFAAGNDLMWGGNTNYDGYASSIYAIAVAAVDPMGQQTWYSNRGASLFISAPSGSMDPAGNDMGVTTTDRTGAAGYNDGLDPGNYANPNYTNDFDGTSAASPIVAGVIALMLEANPDLTYRDVQYILQATAFKNDPNDAEWVENAAGNWVNYKYGFGLIDAAKAVDAARRWIPVAPDSVITSGVIPVNQVVPDNSAQGVSSSVYMPDMIGYIEHVEVTINLPHSWLGDLEVVLISPSGTESYLAEQHDMYTFAYGYNDWTFMTTRCWGEKSGGNWQLIVRDREAGDIGMLVDWTLTIHGVENTGGGPGLIAVIPSPGIVIEDGELLTVGPTELTLRFSMGQDIDPATLGAITVWRAGNDDEFVNDEFQVPIGWIGIGDKANEVIIRFAETLVDDMYEIRIHGKAIGSEVVLANKSGAAFGSEKLGEPGEDLVFSFELDLAPMITAVVPQPTSVDGGTVIQYRDRIDIYFNNDELNSASAENVEYYQLIFTNDTATTKDDLWITPLTAVYIWDETSRMGKVELTFAKDLAEYGEGSFRLRVGETMRGDTSPGLARAYELYEMSLFNEGADVADSFASSTDLSDPATYPTSVNTFGSNTAGQKGQTAIINGRISPYTGLIAGPDVSYSGNFVWPGGNDEPGHRLQPTNDSGIDVEQHIMGWDYWDSIFTPADLTPGIRTISYNFPNWVGSYPNLITEAQKEGTRQILAMISQYMGIRFAELENFADGTSPGAGLSLIVGDLAILGGVSGPGGVAGIGGGGMAVLDWADYGSSDSGFLGTGFTSVMMHEIMHNLGFGHTYDLDDGTIMGDGAGENGYGDFYYVSNAEAAFPGNNDIVHGRYLWRLDGMDIDLYRFSLEEDGTFSAEIIAEQLKNSREAQTLDVVLILFDDKGNVIARNDDYFGKDAFMELALSRGTYFIGVSSKGNDNYDPTIANSGMYGLTEGAYQLRLNYMPIAKDSDTIRDLTGNALDGDLDGLAGGVYNTWFDIRKMENTVYTDKLGRSVQGIVGSAVTLTVTSVTTLDKAMQDASALVLKVTEDTFRNDPALFAAMCVEAGVTGVANYNSLSSAQKSLIQRTPIWASISAASGVAVRVLANNIANDTVDFAYNGTFSVSQDGNLIDNQAYEIGWNNQGRALADGNKLNVPKGVNMTVDEGVVFKLRQANIEIGSRETGIDASHGSLQVLGTPYHPVFFTSYNDESIGKDTDVNKQTPLWGDWGGIVFRNKADYDNNQDSLLRPRVVLEDEGIFVNTVAFADIRYGGGRVNDGGEPISGYLPGKAYTPIYMEEARPTIVFNTLTRNASAAMSADANSFKESLFHDSLYYEFLTTNPTLQAQQLALAYTQDYNRVGPHIRGNSMTATETTTVNGVDVSTKYTNSMNGILVRVDTLAGGSLQKLDVTARFDDYDIVHIFTENLVVAGNTTGRIGRFDKVTNTLLYYEARPSGGLHIDPGIITKLNSTLIEVETGAHIIAEGTTAKPIVFTSVYDDRYGAGGNFDTTNNRQTVTELPGQWGGIYFQPDSSGYFDQARFMFAGGTAVVGGEYFNFNTIEARQAFLRVANSLFEHNAANAGGGNRQGHGAANNAVINIMNAQPIIVNNRFLDNKGAVISINANSMIATQILDPGRATGLLTEKHGNDTDDYHAIYSDYSNNSGPLVRENRMQNNTINGMVIRAETLTTECTWDDTDIVHVVYGEIVIPNFHHYGGLRLVSSPQGSLVVKFYGANAGITASGKSADIEDRIGGRLQIIGMPGFPVVLTSLSDSTVGAGLDFDGHVMKATNNAQNSIAFPGEWRGLVLDKYSNDRNVETVIEWELPSGGQDINGTTASAQYLGELAGNILSGDENLRLGFEIHGTIQTDNRADVDVYSFRATPGQTIWIDVDETTYNLDTMIELIDFDGNVLATSIYSVNETNWLSGVAMAESAEQVNAGVAAKLTADNTLFLLACGQAGITGVANYGLLSALQIFELQKTQTWAEQSMIVQEEYRARGLQAGMHDSIWNREVRDYYAINPKDAGMRVVLPGPRGSGSATNIYYLRVTSYVPDYLLEADELYNDGQTGGRYQIQVRLQESQEIAGSMISYADIRYAVNGIVVRGMPLNSSLTTETADIEGWGIGLNNRPENAQFIGNVLETNHASITVAGVIGNIADIDWFRFDVNLPGMQLIEGVTDNSGVKYPVEFDIDYADGMARPNVDIWIFNTAGELILSGSGSSLIDDMERVQGNSDINRGSYGAGDPTIGPIYLPLGTYYVAVALSGLTPAIVHQTLIRQEPIESLYRVVEDHIISGSYWNTPAAGITNLNLTPEKMAFSDVVMYIGTRNDLYTVNPFTGQVLTDWTTPDSSLPAFDAIYYGDIYMCNDGRMYAMPNMTFEGQTPPQFIELDLGDARAAKNGNTRSTELYARIPDEEPSGVIGENGYMVQLESLISGIGLINPAGQRVNRGFYAVGHTTAVNTYGSILTTNLLWRFDDNGVAQGFPRDNVDQDRLPTNPVPMARLYTAPTLTFQQATDTLFVRNDPNDFDNPGDILDGTQIVVDYDTRNVITDDIQHHQYIFELDTGYDLELHPQGPLGIMDGDTFSITAGGRTVTFEFDCGAGILLSAGNLKAYLEGFLHGAGTHFSFMLQNPNADPPVAATFEVIDSSRPQDSGDEVVSNDAHIAIDIANANTTAQIALEFINAINGAGLGVTASFHFVDLNGNGMNDANEPWRIMFDNSVITDLPLYEGDGQIVPGVVQWGTNGVTPGNVAIPFSINQANLLQSDQLLGQAIISAVNNAFGGQVYASYAYRAGEDILNDVSNIYNRIRGDRITISGVTPITVSYEQQASFAVIRASGQNNDFQIAGALDADHHAMFFNGVNISFVKDTTLGAVQVGYTETWDPLELKVTPSALVITYNPNTHTAQHIVNALNTYQFASVNPATPGLMVHPFAATVTPTDTSNPAGMNNSGAGIVNLDDGYTAVFANGSRGTAGLRPNLDFNGNIAVDGVSDGTYRVRISAEMTGLEIAQALAAAVNQAAAAPGGGMFEGIYSGLDVSIVRRDSALYTVTNFRVTTPDLLTIRNEGEGPGGNITGMTWLHGGESGDVLYAVCDKGGLYRIDGLPNVPTEANPGNYNFDLLDVEGLYKSIYLKNGQLPITITFIADLADIFRDHSCQFTSLSNGPQTVENGFYSGFLFATDADGVMYCFNTSGRPQNVFYNGQSTVNIARGLGGNLAGVTGIAFSPIDFNLWMMTDTRGGETGHGITETYSATRDNEIEPLPSGGLSMYYGLQNTYGPATYNNIFADPFLNATANARIITNYSGTNPEALRTYDTPGGNSGSLVTSTEFSLVGYSAADQPFMTFNYYLDTDVHHFSDTFRVYITSTDPNWANHLAPADTVTVDIRSDQSAAPRWVLLDSNNVQLGPNSTPGLRQGGVNAAEGEAGWHQAVIDLSAYAGWSNLSLRFEFATSGTLGVGDMATVGDWLYALPAYRLSSGDSFTIEDGVNQILPENYRDFEILLGHKLLLPGSAGAQLTGNDWFSITDYFGTTREFCFRKNGSTIRPGSIAIDITDGMSSTQVALLIRNAISGSSLAGVTASVVTDLVAGANLDRIVDEQNVFIDGAAKVEMHTDRNVTLGSPTSTQPSVDGQAPANYTGTLALETLDRIQLTPFSYVISGAPQWTAINGYRFSVSDRYGHTVNFVLGNVTPLPGEVLINFSNYRLLTTGLAGDMDGDGDFDTQDAATILALAIDAQVRAGNLLGISVYATGDSLMVKGAGYIRTDGARGGAVVGHSWKAGGDTLLNPTAFPVRYGAGGERLTFRYNSDISGYSLAHAMATAIENYYNSHHYRLGDFHSNDHFSFGGDTIFWIRRAGEPATPPVSPNVVIVDIPAGASQNQALETLLAAVYNRFPEMRNYLEAIRNADGTMDLYYTPVSLGVSNLTFTAVQDGLRDYNETLNRLNTYTACKYKATTTPDTAEPNKINIIGSNSAPRRLMSGGPLPFTTQLQNDIHSAPDHPQGAPPYYYWSYYSHQSYIDGELPILQGQNNQFEGVYIDDIVIGFRERGTMYTQSDTNGGFYEGNPVYDFVGSPPDGAVLSGQYQLQVRRSADFGWMVEDQLVLMRAFDTNDRFATELTLVCPEGSEIPHLYSFTIGDGKSEVQFQFILDTLRAGALKTDSIDPSVTRTMSGALPIFYTGTETSAQIAALIAAAVNRANVIYSSHYLYTFEVMAGISGNGNIHQTALGMRGGVDLLGAAWINASGPFTYIKHNDSDNGSYFLNMNLGLYVGNEFTGQGDTNTKSAGQGMIFINSNLIAYSAENGILIESGVRDYNGAHPFPGVAAVLATTNAGNLVSGVAVMNNIVAYSGTAGISINGDTYSYTIPDDNGDDGDDGDDDGDGAGNEIVVVSEIHAARLFAHIVNNTIYGNGTASLNYGIYVGENVAPTLLNNIVANAAVGIYVDGSSNAYTVVGHNAFQLNAVNGVLGSDAIVLAPTDPLFVDPKNLNFYPAAGSKVIDSARDSLTDRAAFVNLRNQLGIQPSPIIAPALDIYGQARTNDPNSQYYSGGGLTSFKDRGAIDRVDFVGPTAWLITPMDNDPSIDRDPYIADAFVTSQSLTSFRIQLTDVGIGVNPATVTRSAVQLYRWVNNDSYDPANAVLLREGIDYIFDYDSLNNVITLYPVTGVWKQGFRYQIILANDTDTYGSCIADLAGNPLQANRPNGNPVEGDIFAGTTQFWIRLSGLNYGDAPDPTYPTYVASGGAAHLIIPGFNLGTGISASNDANPNSTASSDPNDDGILFPYDMQLKRGTTVTVTVYVTANAIYADANGYVGYLNAWLDMNATGNWADTIDYIWQDIPVKAGENEIEITIPNTVGPAGFNPGNPDDAYATFARFRLTHEPMVGTGLDYRGEASNGEVEDYMVYIVNEYMDFGDAPKRYDGSSASERYQSTDPARHIITYDPDGKFTGPHFGNVPPDTEYVPQWSEKADGDNKHGVDDEVGIQLGVLVAGSYFYATFDVELNGAAFDFERNGAAGAWISGWMDTDGSGNWVQVIADTYVTEADLENGRIAIRSIEELPVVNNMSTYMRFRISTQSGLGATGLAPDGEVQDYQVFITGDPKDFGDAPNSYGTTLANNGPWHYILLTEDFYLGRRPLGSTSFVGVDAEMDGQPSVNADGDDLNGPYNDENGVFFETLVPGRWTTITVEVTGAGWLFGWMDFNKNGRFDASEMIIYAGMDTGAARPTSNLNVEGFFVTTGTYEFNVYIPDTVTAGTSYARFRLNSEPILAEGPLGEGAYGEVEDYKVTFELGNGLISGYVFNDLNNNGLWDMQINTNVPTFNFVTPSNQNVLQKGSNTMVNVPLGFTFEYFGYRYTNMYVYTDGFVTLGNVTLPNNAPITKDVNVPMIAVFWSDVDTLVGGTVSYDRGISSISGNAYVQVTWSGVRAAGSTNGLENTYVLYIENNAGGDIVAIRYDKLNWTTAPTHGGGANGLGEQPALAGFFSGTGQFIEIGTVNTREGCDRLTARGTYTYRFDPSTGQPGGKEPGLIQYDAYNPAAKKYYNQSIIIYIDIDNDGKFDPAVDPYTHPMYDDPTTTEDELGYFEFTGLFAGEYTIRMEKLYSDLWQATAPNRTTSINPNGTLDLLIPNVQDVEHRSSFTLTQTVGAANRTATFEFINLKYGAFTPPLGSMVNYIYYNSDTDTTVDLVKKIASVIIANKNGLTLSATASGLHLILGSGVYDIDISKLNGAMTIASSHTNPQDGAMAGGYYTVYLAGDQKVTGVNFGAFRKGELTILDTVVTEGNQGYKEIEITIELTGSFGGDYFFEYWTDSYQFNDEIVGYYVDEFGNFYTDEFGNPNRPIYRGQAVAGEQGQIVGYFVEGITLYDENGIAYVVPGPKVVPIYADYQPAHGYYSFISTPQGTPDSDWYIYQMTHTTKINNYDSRISGSRIVYISNDGHDNEIYVYDHSVGAVIWHTDNQVDDNYCDISGDWVVWSSMVDGKYQLFAYNLETNQTVRLTDNPLRDCINARISGTTVVWEEVIDAKQEVSELKVADITNNPIVNAKVLYRTNPDLDKLVPNSIRINTNDAGVAQAVWTIQAKTGDKSTRVWYYDGVAARSITTGGSVSEQKPQISNGVIVYEQGTGEATNISYYVIGTATPVRVTTNGLGNVDPQIDHGIIVWSGRDAITAYRDIFYYDINTRGRVVNITNSADVDERPVIFGNRIAWRMQHVSPINPPLRVWDICYYEIGTGVISVNITQDDKNDAYPIISEDMIVWRGTENNETDGYQIYIATKEMPRVRETIKIRIYGDTTIEEDELFRLILREIEGGNLIIRDGQAIITILNDDGPMDFGDAPSKYPVLLKDNGARHNANSGYILGTRISAETDGQPSPHANAYLHDKDGVTLPEIFVPGTMATISVFVTLPAGVTEAKLDAWIDFNNNGDWLDAGDQILSSYTVHAGMNTITIPVPRTAYEGLSYARFRLSAEGGLAPTGYCTTGEVEDYEIKIGKLPANSANTLKVFGSDSENVVDNIVFEVLSGSQYRITVNGAPFTNQGKNPSGIYNAAEFSMVLIDGQSGPSDSFTFIGSPEQEDILIWPSEAYFFVPGHGLSVNVTNFTYITAEGNGGADTVQLYGSYRDDIFTDNFDGVWRNVEMTERDNVPGRIKSYDSVVKNLDMAEATVTVYASQGGNDRAEINSIQAGDQVLVNGKLLTVKNAVGRVVTRLYDVFEMYVDGVLKQASLEMHGASIHDSLTVGAGSILLSSTDYKMEMNGFANASVYSSGMSQATLKDTAGDDTFTISPNYAKRETVAADGSASSVSVYGFAGIQLQGENGGTGSISMYDSVGNDTLIMKPQFAEMYGDGYKNTISGFHYINAYSENGGDDQVSLYDSTGDDIIYTKAQSVDMFNANYYNYANGFKSMSIFSVNGGSNRAYMYDSYENDTVISYAEYTNMFSDSYSTTVYGAKSVDIIATSGGANTAKLYDSALGDLLEAGSNWASLVTESSNVKRTVSDFDSVEVVSKGNSVTETDLSAIDFLITSGLWKKK